MKMQTAFRINLFMFGLSALAVASNMPGKYHMYFAVWFGVVAFISYSLYLREKK